MFDSLTHRLHISTTVAVMLLVMAAVQIALQVWALVDLVRRRTVPSGNKWLWAAVIVLFGLPGAIGYLAVVRTSSTVEEPGGSTASGARREGVQRAVDALYGKRERQ